MFKTFAGNLAMAIVNAKNKENMQHNGNGSSGDKATIKGTSNGQTETHGKENFAPAFAPLKRPHSFIATKKVEKLVVRWVN